MIRKDAHPSTNTRDCWVRPFDSLALVGYTSSRTAFGRPQCLLRSRGRRRWRGRAGGSAGGRLGCSGSRLNASNNLTQRARVHATPQDSASSSIREGTGDQASILLRRTGAESPLSPSFSAWISLEALRAPFLFKFIDYILQKTGKIGEYDQKM